MSQTVRAAFFYFTVVLDFAFIVGMFRVPAMFKGHPHYERTAEFVALCHIPTFDPAAEALSLSDFEPMLRRLIAAPKQWIYKASRGPGAARA